MQETWITELHAKLQALDSRVVFLLGGSAARGEALPDSDVDFYCLGSYLRLKKLKGVLNQLLKDQPREVSCVLIPNFIRPSGIYGLDGKVLNGDRYSAQINRRAILFNCFLLGSRLWDKAVHAEDGPPATNYRRALVQALAGMHLSYENGTSAVFARYDIIKWCKQYFSNESDIILVEKILHGQLSHGDFAAANILVRQVLLDLARVCLTANLRLTLWYPFVFHIQWYRAFRRLSRSFNPAIIVLKARQKMLLGETLTPEESIAADLQFPIWIIPS